MNFQELQKIFFKIDNKIKVELLFITLLTAIFSLWGGLPFYHPDFLVDKVHHILNNNGNPNFLIIPVWYYISIVSFIF